MSLGLGSGEAMLAQTTGQKPSYTPELSGISLETAEKTMLLDALQKAGWNQTRAAQLLSITRDTLRYKMKKFNLRSGVTAAQPE